MTEMVAIKTGADTTFVKDNQGNAAEISAVAAEVNKSGVHSLMNYWEGLKQGTSSPDRETTLTALAALSRLLRECPEAAEPYVAELLPAILQQASHKQAPVQRAATATATALAETMSSDAILHVLPHLFAAMEHGQGWQTRVLALEILAGFGDHAPEQLGHAVPQVVPLLSPCMSDTKRQVKEAAAAAMTAACDVIGNRDVEHLTGDIVKAVVSPAAVPEIIHRLAGVTFVQSVEPPALAMVVPLLLRGLRAKETATKRQSAVIIENMSKLVDEPTDAAPFLPLLMPALEKAAASVADPEARGIADRAHAQLARLDGLCRQGGLSWKQADSGEVLAAVKEVMPLPGATDKGKDDEFVDVALSYVSCMCCSLMDRKRTGAEDWLGVVSRLAAIAGPEVEDAAAGACVSLREMCAEMMVPEEVEEGDAADDLCDCQFTLAYGTKILLHNTRLRLRRGAKYGLLGGNDSGKTTLMRAIAMGSVEGFPHPSEVRTVFVEADIQGEQSHLSCVDYIMADPRIQDAGIARDAVKEVLATVGFTEDGKAKPENPVSTLSGGWRMKLAMARAMLQKADILLLDEPTNHLDVINVAWVKSYLDGLKDVTAVMVSHDAGLLNDCCTDILAIKNLKLERFHGNLDAYVKLDPSAKSFFELKATKLAFTFPQPGPIEGIKSKGKALMKMSKCFFTYPGNETPTLFDISIQVSLSSRVACVGENGAGKSTMIKVLTGEVVPQQGDVWRHPNARVAYLAQHAFHHIENHMDQTPNEYIRWRYAKNGEDKESLVKVSMVATDEEQQLQRAPFELQWTQEEDGKTIKAKKVVAELLGGRRQDRSKGGGYMYEVRYAGANVRDGAPDYLPKKTLERLGWGKAVKAVDARLAQTAGLYMRPLSSSNVERHLGDCGLVPEFATHTRISALSGGQKVKVVLAAAMWNQPHVVILDEPTNYLDRESLGALAKAIDDFQGGVVIVSHNNEFVSSVCPEEWVMEGGRLETRGDAGWMERQDEKISDQAVIEEVTDAAGNVSAAKGRGKKALSKREQKALTKKIRAKLANEEGLDTDEEDFAAEHDLF